MSRPISSDPAQPHRIANPAGFHSLTSSRVDAFSDGVFAIAVTLLILNVQLPKPEAGGLGRELLRLWPEYATYAASFLTIGIMWLNHHALFSRVERVDRPLVMLNLLLLMVVAFIPFPTQVLGTHLGGSEASTAALFYSLSSVGTAVGFSAVYLYVARHPSLLDPRFRHADFMKAMPWFSIGFAVYLAGIAVSFINPPLVVAMMAVTAVYYAWDRLPGPSDPEPTA
jgi:uncharacterized membrane protein